jgi:UDP-N-acetylglucosamine--N-acetylmuramyl-(pentapeptide) pyrophosphoryl-undecaprenol N-acetylglucosamine transferase
MKVVFTGGGTGGHIYPIIALTREIKKVYANFDFKGKKKKKLEFYYIGPKDRSTKNLLTQEGIRVKKVMAGKIRRYFGIRAFFQNLVSPFKVLFGIIQSFQRLFYLAPDLIFSKGGYGSFPVVFAARLLRIPVFLHESDAIFGLANKTLSKRSAEVFVSFPDTENVNVSKMILVGNVIRRELLEGSEKDARKLFEIVSNKPVLLIMGGSQGAQRINNLILNILPKLLNNFEIIHQVGPKNFESFKTEAVTVLTEETKKLYHPVAYIEELRLKHAFKVSNLIISRAGSGSIFEIAALGKPSIIVPLAGSAQDHQAKNAYNYAKGKAAIVIEEENLTPNFFLGILKNIFTEPKIMERMEKAALEFAKPRAGEIIANYIIEYLTQ